MNSSLLIFLGLLFCWAAGESRAALTIDVRSHGAKGDGVVVDTQAIQVAIDECSRQGGGTVRFAAGQYVSGTILLKDNVTLELDAEATLLGSTNILDYQAPDKFRSGNGAEMGYCFIGAVDARNVGIKGAGLIDGRGKAVLAARPQGNSARPFLARFVRSDGIAISGVRLQGSAAWTVHLSQSKNITVERVTIRCRGLSNNDGIDIDSSQAVRIRECDIDTGDDAICLKTTSSIPTRDVEVTGCKLKSHWAAVKFGTESMANFEDVRITHCEIRDTEGGGIKLLSVDGARMRNILISDLTMENVKVPLFIRLGSRLRTFRAGEEKKPVGTISNVTVRNVRATATPGIGMLITGIPGHTVNDVKLENIELRLAGGGTLEEAKVVLEEKEAAYPEITMFGKQLPASGLFARHVKGLTAIGVKLHLAAPDLRPAIACIDAENVVFADWKLPANEEAESLLRFDSTRQASVSGFQPIGSMRVFLRVEGEKSAAIGLKNNLLGSARKVIEAGAEVNAEAVTSTK